MGGLLLGMLATTSTLHRRGAAAATQPAPGKVLRIGLIGLDTSHVTAFTALLNDPANPDHIPGARVVAAFKGGSPDVEASATRIDKFTAELRDKWKIEIVDSIEALLPKVDVVMIESVDARVHLAQARAGDRREEAAVHRQADGGQHEGRRRDRPPREGGRRAAVQRVVASLRRGRADAAEPTRRSGR